MTVELVLATTHRAKQRELRDLLRPYPDIDPLNLYHFKDLEDAPRDLDAEQRATYWARQLDRLVLVDQSVLIVPGLKDFSLPEEEDLSPQCLQELLQRTQHLDGISRAAYFECTLILASPSNILKKCSATMEGLLTSQARGSNGFGYDSIFLKHDYDKTLAELSPTVKNRISHRSKAFQLLSPQLERILQEDPSNNALLH